MHTGNLSKLWWRGAERTLSEELIGEAGATWTVGATDWHLIAALVVRMLGSHPDGPGSFLSNGSMVVLG